MVVVVARVAYAEPQDAPACSSCEPGTFAVRAGLETDTIRISSENDPATAFGQPMLALEGGQWITPDTRLTLGGSFRAFDFIEYPDPTTHRSIHVQFATLGMRVSHHGRKSKLFGGFGVGGTWSRVTSPDGIAVEGGHYLELFAGLDVARVGSLVVDLQPSVTLGTATMFGGALGLHWDPPHQPRCPDPPGAPGAVAVRVGEAHSEFDSGDLNPRGWGPWVEVELGVRASERVVVAAFASYTKFTDTAEYSYGRGGVRAQLWPVRRVFVAPGVGFVGGHGGGALLDLEIGIELVRWQHLVLEAIGESSTTPSSSGVLEASYGVGIAYR